MSPNMTVSASRSRGPVNDSTVSPKPCRSVAALFREERPTFNGRYYSISDARNVPRPIRPGGPPIMIGGSGERRTLRLVAQYADMCNVSGGPETVAHKLDVLRAHCR